MSAEVELRPSGWPPLTRRARWLYAIAILVGLWLAASERVSLTLTNQGTVWRLPVMVPWLVALACVEGCRLAAYRSRRFVMADDVLTVFAGVLRERERARLERRFVVGLELHGTDVELTHALGTLVLPGAGRGALEAIRGAWPEVVVGEQVPREALDKRRVARLALIVIFVAAAVEAITAIDRLAQADFVKVSGAVLKAVDDARAAAQTAFESSATLAGLHAAHSNEFGRSSFTHSIWELRPSGGSAEFKVQMSAQERGAVIRMWGFAQLDAKYRRWGLSSETVVEIEVGHDELDRVARAELVKSLDAAGVKYVLREK